MRKSGESNHEKFAAAALSGLLANPGNARVKADELIWDAIAIGRNMAEKFPTSVSAKRVGNRVEGILLSYADQWLNIREIYQAIGGRSTSENVRKTIKALVDSGRLAVRDKNDRILIGEEAMKTLTRSAYGCKYQLRSTQ